MSAMTTMRPGDHHGSDAPSGDAGMSAATVCAALDHLGHVPLPGGGQTAARFGALRDVAAQDLALVRLVEGHLDAVAILAEAGRPEPVGLSGVWAADPPDGRVTARRSEGGGWVLHGTKRWCSGAGALDRTLITAHADDGYRLFDVALDHTGIQIDSARWQAVGMADSATADVACADVALAADSAVGAPGWYLQRPGFWGGGIGVAACWFGGAVGATCALRAAVGRRTDDHHGLAHLGAAESLCAAMQAHLDAAAAALDNGLAGPALRRLAWEVRAAVERLAPEVLDHAVRGIGAGGITGDRAMARRVADLPVYLRQHHAERDLEALGRLVLET